VVAEKIDDFTVYEIKPKDYIARVQGMEALRERNLRIILLYSDGYVQEEIAHSFGLTQRAISKILNANVDLVNELTIKIGLANKGGRIRFVKRLVHNALKNPKGLSLKSDAIDILNYLRKEMEGDKTTFSGELKVDLGE